MRKIGKVRERDHGFHIVIHCEGREVKKPQEIVTKHSRYRLTDMKFEIAI